MAGYEKVLTSIQTILKRNKNLTGELKSYHENLKMMQKKESYAEKSLNVIKGDVQEGDLINQ